MKNELNLIDFLKLLHCLQYWSYYDSKHGNELLTIQRVVRHH
jgi:hypothetical protein